jgi:dephospho-CoA kinase
VTVGTGGQVSPDKQRMQIIGLLGGVASGKSMVARQFAQLGAGLLDADRIGHEVLQLPAVEAAARERWGVGIFGPDGHVDRTRLARVVFAPGAEGKRQREHLEQITHPEIARLTRQEIASLAAAGFKAAVCDAALLLEAGWSDWCERVVFVECPREMRLARARARGWSEEEFAAREGAQESLDRKRRRADAIVDNSGSPERTRAQVEHFWTSLFP